MNSNSSGRSLPFDDWPEADRAMWEDLTTLEDMFGDPGGFAHLRPATVRAYQRSYAQWLAHLVGGGVDLDAEAPDARATVERLRRYLDAIAHLSPRTRAHLFSHLHRVLSEAYPDSDWSRLRNARNTLSRRANDAGCRRSGDLMPSSDLLIDIGLRQIENARGNMPLRRSDALAWRNGLLVAMLACHALRCRTLASLVLGSTIRRDGRGFAIWASAADMKMGRPFEFRLSPLLAGEMDEYLARARPLFDNGSDPDRGPLWLTYCGRQLRPESITHAVGRLTRACLRHRTTPHLFRHAAMTTMANASGFDARLGQHFLSHRRPETSERHFNLATQLDAGRAFADLLGDKLGVRRRRRR